MEINKIAIQCNLLAFGFLDMYKNDGNEMTENLTNIWKELKGKFEYYTKQGVNTEKEVMNAYDKFTNFVDENDTVVKALPFCLRFIVLNPRPSKKLLKMAIKEEKYFKFNKDPKVVEAKELVRKFLSE